MGAGFSIGMETAIMPGENQKTRSGREKRRQPLCVMQSGCLCIIGLYCTGKSRNICRRDKVIAGGKITAQN